MRYLVLAAVAAGLLLAASGAVADEFAQAPISAKRQVTDCMTKRMNASRTLTYNDASKACKAWVKSQKMDSAANLVPKSPVERLPGT